MLRIKNFPASIRYRVMQNILNLQQYLTHWGRVTHICVGNLTIIGSDNGLSPGRRQVIILTNTWMLLIGPLGTNFSDFFISIQTFSFKEMHLKMSSVKWRPFCLGFAVSIVQSHQMVWVFQLGRFKSLHAALLLCNSEIRNLRNEYIHDHVIIWKLFQYYWPFVRGIDWSSV